MIRDDLSPRFKSKFNVIDGKWTHRSHEIKNHSPSLEDRDSIETGIKKVLGRRETEHDDLVSRY